MAVATPENLLEVLRQLATNAAEQAAAQPAALAEALEQAVPDPDQITALPAEVLQRLKDAVDPPDWFSLLVFVLVRLAELDPEHLSVGALAPAAGWGRAVTLTYTDANGSATLALALTDPGTTKGLLLRVGGNPTATFGSDVVSVTVAGTGSGEWRVPFSGGLQAPAAGATLRLSVAVDLGLNAAPATGVSLGVGPALLTLDLASTAPLWALDVGLGDGAAKPGLHAGVDLAPSLGLLATVVNITPLDERYSPRITVGAGREPAFTLGNPA